MGGHGGLNILPQKSWNVYNYENREKVRRDEEAAAKEEQLKREQSRKRDAEFRLESLRQARGIEAPRQVRGIEAPRPTSPDTKEADSKHINLFEGLKVFPFEAPKEDEDRPKIKKPKKEAPKVILPEDEKYRLGYGVAGKGVKAPWYLSRPSDVADAADVESPRQVESSKNTSGKKTLEELREERLKREKREKERERGLLFGKNGIVRGTSLKFR